jgi:hypothetical protein
MKTYRKRPVEIEAERYDRANGDELIVWMRDAGTYCYEGRDHLYIRTLEGMMFADIGDWVIRGVAGEFYPCKPDIFAATYEAVEAS